jgi:hypothetical protein
MNRVANGMGISRCWKGRRRGVVRLPSLHADVELVQRRDSMQFAIDRSAELNSNVPSGPLKLVPVKGDNTWDKKL